MIDSKHLAEIRERASSTAFTARIEMARKDVPFLLDHIASLEAKLSVATETLGHIWTQGVCAGDLKDELAATLSKLKEAP